MNGIKYLIKKTITLIITLFVISVITFAAFQIIPGDSVISKLGTNYTQEKAEALREELGLNKPVYERYTNWVVDFLSGDLGTSLSRNMPVEEVIKGTFTVTMYLSFLSMILVLLLAIPIAIVSSGIKNKYIISFLNVIDHIFLSFPSFFLGIVISIVFGLLLRWFIPGRYISYNENFFGFIITLLAPAFSLAIPKVAMLNKFLKTTINEELKKDYTRTALSKGYTKKQVIRKHVLKNALVLVTTIMGIMSAEMIAGSIVAEQVFSLPGMGRVLIDSISRNDYPVVQALVIYIATVVVFINYIMDIIYRLIDPRIN